jgi:DNA polymerase-1
MGKLLVVDGSNLLFQMFYGMPARITGKCGRAIQGTLGFVGALGKIVRSVKPTHVAVLFDGEGEKERPMLDAEYKANRPDWDSMPEDEIPFSQLPDIYAALDHLGIKHRECTAYECDDVIASYAKTYGVDNDIIISSFDSDFFQLLTDRVSVLRYRGECSVLCTPEYVRERLGVSPSSYADYKSLVGDTADNVKGVPKVGPKTAAALIAEFGSAEGVIAGVDSIGKAAIRESVRASTDRIRLNCRLIRLDGAAPLPFALDELEFSGEMPRTREILEAIGAV